MIEQNLRLLDRWYGDASHLPDQTNFLSKLAILELSGWLEEEFDRIILVVESFLLQDQEWVKRELINKTFGCHYDKHFRKMLCTLIGEANVRIVETVMEFLHPGELDQLKSALSNLWKKRCQLAHADLGSYVQVQRSIDAPSRTLATYTSISSQLEHFEIALINNFNS